MRGKKELSQLPFKRVYWNPIPGTLHKCPKNGVCLIAIAPILK
jgi:hypothetical protein